MYSLQGSACYSAVVKKPLSKVRLKPTPWASVRGAGVASGGGELVSRGMTCMRPVIPQLLLNRGADPSAVDSLGRTALQHAMHLDKAASLKVAAALLQVRAWADGWCRQLP